VLCCAVLCCAVLCCAVLCCAQLVLAANAWCLERPHVFYASYTLMRALPPAPQSPWTRARWLTTCMRWRPSNRWRHHRRVSMSQCQSSP